ncbi:uncharacterized protein LOC122256150 [Penaeus japonicus]|uniref:uncharacterized protein LOC122256150 n=1 Tax=Penaeus japonicus TaxID=27405 RepID=UPI001C70EF7A|nr:uncharacterized protein LOC122256150 [Penaeus japonicus]
MQISRALLAAVLCVCVCHGQLDIPSVSDEEMNEILKDVPRVAQCLTNPDDLCHPLTAKVRLILPELYRNSFQCHTCSKQSQKNIAQFRSVLSSRENSRYNREIFRWVTEQISK